jgi:hypothetical protein
LPALTSGSVTPSTARRRRRRAKVRAAILAKRQGNPTENEQRLARACAILALLEGEPLVQSQSAE